MAKRMDRTPACIETRAPHTTRASMSRPRSSVPNGCAQLGALRIALQLVAFGSPGATPGAPMATTTNASTITSPTTAGGRRARRRQLLRTRSPRVPRAAGARVKTSAALVAEPSGLIAPAPDPDPRVEQRIGEVDQEVHQH